MERQNIAVLTWLGARIGVALFLVDGILAGGTTQVTGWDPPQDLGTG